MLFVTCIYFELQQTRNFAVVHPCHESSRGSVFFFLGQRRLREHITSTFEAIVPGQEFPARVRAQIVGTI